MKKLVAILAFLPLISLADECKVNVKHDPIMKSQTKNVVCINDDKSGFWSLLGLGNDKMSCKKIFVTITSNSINSLVKGMQEKAAIKFEIDGLKFDGFMDSFSDLAGDFAMFDISSAQDKFKTGKNLRLYYISVNGEKAIDFSIVDMLNTMKQNSIIISDIDLNYDKNSTNHK